MSKVSIVKLSEIAGRRQKTEGFFKKAPKFKLPQGLVDALKSSKELGSQKETLKIPDSIKKLQDRLKEDGLRLHEKFCRETDALIDQMKETLKKPIGKFKAKLPTSAIVQEYNPNEITVYVSPQNANIPNVRVGRPTNGGAVDIETAYHQAVSMQQPSVTETPDIPAEMLRPRRPTDTAYERMRAQYDPRPPVAGVEQEQSQFVAPTVSQRRPVMAERTIDMEKVAQTYDLSWHQGSERVAKYEAIRTELKSLLDELPLKPNLHQLLEVIHKRYPDLHVKTLPKEELVEKVLLHGLEKNTPLYTEQKKAYMSGFFAFFLPGSSKADSKLIQEGANMIAEKAPPKAAQLIKAKAQLDPHEIFGVHPEKPMMVVNKDGTFFEAFHELIHYLQDREGLKFSNYSEIPKAMIPDRISAKSKVMQAAMGGMPAPLTYSERQVVKPEALAEAEVGQLISQLLPGKVPEESYAMKQHPYTLGWMGALPDLGKIRPYHPEAVKTTSAAERYWRETADTTCMSVDDLPNV